MLTTIIFLFFLFINLCQNSTDRTLEERSTGFDVVVAVIEKVHNESLCFSKEHKSFSYDQNIMKRIAYVETIFGTDNNTFKPGNSGGIWNTEASEMWGWPFIKFPTKEQIEMSCGSNGKVHILELIYNRTKNLWIPISSGLVARKHLDMINEPIPEYHNIYAQAKYWTNHYNSNNAKNKTVEYFIDKVIEMEKEYGITCRGRMDLAIVLDGSGSIRAKHFNEAKDFAKSFVQSFSPDSTNIGLILFSSRAQVIFPLDSNLTLQSRIEMIEALHYPDEMTNTNLGITMAVDILSKAHKREGVPKIIGIFTDGRPTCSKEELMKSLNLAKSNNITIIATGIGYSINNEVLVEMANSSNHVYSLSSYKALSESFRLFNSEMCKIPQKPEVGKIFKDIVDKMEERFFVIKMPPQGMMVRLMSSRSQLPKGFWSFTNKHPSSAVNDGVLTKSAFIAPRSTALNRSAENVFLTIQGIENASNYSLATEQGNHLLNLTKRNSTNQASSKIGSNSYWPTGLYLIYTSHLLLFSFPRKYL